MVKYKINLKNKTLELSDSIFTTESYVGLLHNLCGCLREEESKVKMVYEGRDPKSEYVKSTIEFIISIHNDEVIQK